MPKYRYKETPVRNRDDLDPARGIIYAVLVSAFIYAGGYLAAAIYTHASEPEPVSTCENYYGQEVPCP